MSRIVVPLVDLRRQHAEVSEEIRRGWDEVVGDAAFVLGDVVARFEQAFAAFCGVGHCVGVGSGTDALELALRAAGIGPGDEVIVPANTFVGTAVAVGRVGAQAVPVDIDPATYLCTAASVEAAVTARTRAVLPVDLFGQVPPMEDIEAVARRHCLTIVEDAAQAHGASRHGRGAGGFGIAAGTSFYPAKNLGAYGDGGAVLTDSAEVAESVRAMRDHGRAAGYSHSLPGMTSRLDSLQAVVLLAKLAHLPTWNRQRQAAAARYDELLGDLDDVVVRPATAAGNEHVWHLYVVRVPRRDDVLGRLRGAGIGAQVHYRCPLHLHPALDGSGRGHRSLPQAERAAGEVLSLPLFPGITAEEQETVVGALRRALP